MNESAAPRLMIVPPSSEIDPKPVLFFAPLDQRSDVANGPDLVRYYDGNFRYVVGWECWIAWDGRSWCLPGAHLMVQEVAIKFAKDLETFLKKIQNKNAKRDYEHALSVRGYQAAITVSRSYPGVAIEHEALDKAHWHLPVANGVLMLKGQNPEFLPHQRDLLYTHVSPVAYDPEATCPAWLKFVDEVFSGDQELISFVRRCVGYTLTGKVSEHRLFFMLGNGRNGKSTFTNIISAIFGKFTYTMPQGLLEEKNQNQHATELTGLHGSRLAIAHEARKGKKWDESRVKQLTGGDAITANRMRQDHYTFAPTHKVWVLGNDLPVISGTDDGIWGRIFVIAFKRKFEIDDTIEPALMAELPGILNWAVDGCRDWQEIGLQPPASVMDRTAEFRKDQDAFGQFVEDACILQDGRKIGRVTLRKAYEKWCEEEGYGYPLGARQFKARISELGVKESTVRNDHGSITSTSAGWVGIGLKSGTDM